MVAEPSAGHSPSASACEPYREAIELGVSRGRNAKAIWQDLVDSQGFTSGYQSVQRFVGKLRKTAPPEARAVIETAPGEEARSARRFGSWALNVVRTRMPAGPSSKKPLRFAGRLKHANFRFLTGPADGCRSVELEEGKKANHASQSSRDG